MKVHQILNHTFIGDLGPAPVVVDAGGNRGEFSAAVLRLYHPRIYLLEPVPDLFRLIPVAPGVTAYQEALVAKDGPVELDLREGYGSVIPGVTPSTPVKVPGVGITTFLSRVSEPEIDLFKMDIEGAEIEVLEQISPDALRRLGQLTVEFHDFLYPELHPRVEAIKSRIKDAGFYAINFSRNNGDVLFVRRDRLSRLAYLWLKYPVKYWRGVKRLIRRHILGHNI